jgi:LCP family protein required for cell wall assembly
MSEDHSFDFLKKKYQLAPVREDRKKESRSFRLFVIALFSVAAAGLFFSFQAQGPSHAENGGTSFSLFNPFARALESIVGGDDDDRINILLLGIGGAGHEGPELTDTMILASIQPSTNAVSMLSIPRDLIVQIPGYGGRKINAVNALAEMKEDGSGPPTITAAVSDMFGQKIDYYVKIDFNSFEYLIDAVEGVDVYVDTSFQDTTYPTDDKGIQTVSFEQGWAHMDGALALKYSRSRHGNNGEGSDFARATRQQKVIAAVKDKLLSTSTFFNPGRLNQLAQLVSKHVTTNMGILDMVRMAKFAPDISSDKVKNFVLDDAPTGPLYSSTLNGAYVLLPKRADWSDLRYLAAHIFEDDASVIVKPKELSAPTQETHISIQNGTMISGLAAQSAELLQSSGFTVTDVNNAATRDHAKTTILDLTKGKKSVELGVLQAYFDAEVTQTTDGWLQSPQTLPDALIDEKALPDLEGVDFLIVLGQDAEQLLLR